MTATVTSADGTRIAFDSTGEGTPVILVGGAMNDRTSVAGLAAVLADAGFRAVAPDRRGRGDSGDAAAYEVAREVEDLAALISHVGGSAAVFGHSSGAILALEAASRGLPIIKVAAYEPPFVVVDSRRRPGEDLVARVRARLSADDRDGAVELFLTEGVGAPEQQVAGMKASPAWSWCTALAPTLAYDLEICGPGNHLPADHLAKIGVPVLAIGGGTGEEWLRAGARAVASAVPGGRYETLEGQDHSVLNQPESLRALLSGFLA
ncbi:alpha/beta hydrolase [Amycolatopsis sp. PS_44_ISF1]|uniref:alpha/beta fold hydrolase n=1 Tax=Amycolatopsis sp. PS_44_ISF1 TaxID=2974917 RepID=UPI0028DF3440|nr:alpha/beta hydrolase [Amycolatopsis sp. PS_44_ISF1]MDT8915621.1 alpha/beta hydrolase [Amycolatopsis sp. PS_44_ISF1]